MCQAKETCWMIREVNLSLNWLLVIQLQKWKGTRTWCRSFVFAFTLLILLSSVKKSSDKISGHFRLLSNFAAKNKLNRIFKRSRVQIPFGRTLSFSYWINKNLPNGFHRVLSMWKNDNEKAKVCREHFYSCISINFPLDSVSSTHQRTLRMMGN